MLFLDDVEETMNKIIIVAVGLLGASLLTAVPAEAQYGGGKGAIAAGAAQWGACNGSDRHATPARR
jgi:hypothetical protein